MNNLVLKAEQSGTSCKGLSSGAGHAGNARAAKAGCAQDERAAEALKSHDHHPGYQTVGSGAGIDW
jgi:hypothetical protein